MNKLWIAIAAIVLLVLPLAGPWARSRPPAPSAATDRRDRPPAEVVAVSLPSPIAAADAEVPTERHAATAIEPTFVLQVKVVDEFDEPVREASITLQHTGAREPFAVHPVDAAGTWRGTVSGAQVVVAAAAEGVGRSVALVLTPERATRDPIALVLARPVQVAGLVIDRHGNAIVDDVVQIEVHDRHWLHSAGSRLSTAAVHTDGLGRFAVEAMVGDRLQLRRRDDPDVQAWITAAADAEAVLAPPGRFQVLVRAVGPDGHPVAAELDFRAPGA